jgi:hypothetical protein
MFSSNEGLKISKLENSRSSFCMANLLKPISLLLSRHACSRRSKNNVPLRELDESKGAAPILKRQVKVFIVSDKEREACHFLPNDILFISIAKHKLKMSSKVLG